MASAAIGYEEEYSAFVEECISLYRQVYANLTIIEHGSSPIEDAAGSCIAHAHWHFLPFAAELRSVFIADGLRKIADIQFERFLLPRTATPGPYIFFSDQEGAALYEASSLPQTQYARSLVGRSMGMSPAEWDWAVVVRKQLFWATYDDLGAGAR